METFVCHSTIHYNKAFSRPSKKDLVIEKRLSIGLQVKPYSVIIRTPADEIQYVAVHCLARRLFDTHHDFASLASCDGADTKM